MSSWTNRFLKSDSNFTILIYHKIKLIKSITKHQQQKREKEISLFIYLFMDFSFMSLMKSKKLIDFNLKFSEFRVYETDKKIDNFKNFN